MEIGMKPVSLIQVFLVLFLAACSGGEGPEMSTADAQMVSGRPILVGGNGGVGPLPSIGISSTPLGFAYVYDGKRPDIFVSSDRWYPGFHLYRYVKDAPNGVPVFSPPIEIDVSELPELENYLLQDHAVAGYVFEPSKSEVIGIWVRHERNYYCPLRPRWTAFQCRIPDRPFGFTQAAKLLPLRSVTMVN